MPDYDDVLNTIDDTLTSEDAMRSVPDSDSPDKQPESRALLMDMQGTKWVSLDGDDIVGQVAELVGDPGVDRASFGIFDIWVGDNSEASGRHNPGNVLLVKPLLRAIVSGDIAAPDRVRDHVRDLLDTDQVTQVYGPALITGPLEEGVPTGLPESVVAWLDARAREGLVRALRQAILDALERGEITVVALGD